MRCPYCGGLNPDKADFCTSCGRTFKPVNPPPAPGLYQQPPRQPYPPAQRPVYPPSPRMNAPVQAVQPAQPHQQRPPNATPPTVRMATAAAHRPPARKEPPPETNGWRMLSPAASASLAAPEPPAPFPPKTIAQLKELEQGALEYQLLSDDGGYGKKKIVRIQFRRCAPWQQIATLSKALREYDQASYNTVIIQGVYNQERNVYEFNNGQLAFDRNVRLGGATLNRYQIETENGFSSDALRIVLSE